MPQFNVSIHVIEVRYVTVNADDSEEAERLAWERYEADPGEPSHRHYETDEILNFDELTSWSATIHPPEPEF